MQKKRQQFLLLILTDVRLKVNKTIYIRHYIDAWSLRNSLIEYVEYAESLTETISCPAGTVSLLIRLVNNT